MRIFALDRHGGSYGDHGNTHERLPESFWDFKKRRDEFLTSGGIGTAWRKSDDAHIVYNLFLSRCKSCEKLSVWRDNRLIYPVTVISHQANDDLPDDIKEVYLEADAIFTSSPRGSAALLRLCVQKLCKHLGQDAKDLNVAIGNLVKRGLDPRVRDALDIVRVVGNNAVHPGQINLTDDPSIAEQLFALVNLVAEIMIATPKHIAATMKQLPPGALAAIERRDGVTALGAPAAGDELPVSSD